MKKHSNTVKQVKQIKQICFAGLGVFVLAGCSGKTDIGKGPDIIAGMLSEALGTELERTAVQMLEEGPVEIGSIETGSIETGSIEAKTAEADWSDYFDGLPGAAVLFDASARQYTVYNRGLAEARHSPCSTFKIISSLIALEEGIIEPDNSVRKWSGETFWKEEWNRDIDFREAFRESCVWYFREVIDEIGPERMQEELLGLAYGNCDCSDWEGRQNTNNSNRALTGFWIESSLAISPREQTEVMARIFGESSVYSSAAQDALRQVMLTEGPDETGVSIYGKTGMGKTGGVLADAWFAGFSEREGEAIYFCVYLGQTERQDASSTRAKEIAIQLVQDYWDGPACIIP